MILLMGVSLLVLAYLYWAIEISTTARLVKRSHTFRLEPRRHTGNGNL